MKCSNYLGPAALCLAGLLTLLLAGCRQELARDGFNSAMSEKQQAILREHKRNQGE
jgi:hypothetical protein